MVLLSETGQQVFGCQSLTLSDGNFREQRAVLENTHGPDVLALAVDLERFSLNGNGLDPGIIDRVLGLGPFAVTCGALNERLLVFLFVDLFEILCLIRDDPQIKRFLVGRVMSALTVRRSA